jgi:L-threonylcarbamoyladenylate synthase
VQAREAELEAAVAHVRAGGLVAYPTETVWGLGADASSAAAVDGLRRWKGREPGQAISLLVDGLEAAERLGVRASPEARRLAARFWPGPLTLILPAPAGRFAPGVARDDGAVGLRCSPDATAAALARALARAGVGPLTATSLNRAGEPPARSAEQARELCRRHPGPRIVDLGAGAVSCAAPSTVVDLCGPSLRLVREGAIPAADVAAAVRPARARAGEANPR